LRISGFAEDANVYAMDLVISIPIAIAFIYACKKASVKAVLAGVIL
jgi:hypothetical protein